VAYDDAWREGHGPVNTFCWLFPTKWMSDDGLQFSLVFSGRQENDSFNVLRGTFINR